ncbi:uncharacterized protein LOC114731047 [Neltuma alba]|uniref:uncharacterized protein LOC114716845 n=1 Tax=Neltuma alba TaxID=207710 RepID=UPI0010A4B9B4|nr:uncharacterized protein LOC114716845 [Prosopis alba]XP_028774011.1 uncharacterized protein LOC114731047 [Prosopis alba]
MGSLMAGWDSPTIDPKSAKLKRNQSLTKEEIDSYWKLKKKTEEEHLRAISNLSETIKENKYEESETKLQKSKSMPLTRTKESVDVDAADTRLEQLIKKNVWWTKSNWAFLNEPPVMEAASSRYASQFHVANMGAPKYNPADGIGA